MFYQKKTLFTKTSNLKFLKQTELCNKRGLKSFFNPLIKLILPIRV